MIFAVGFFENLSSILHKKKHIYFLRASLLDGVCLAGIPLSIVGLLLVLKICWRKSRGSIGTEGSSKEEDEGFGLMDLVVDPSSALGHTDSTPFVLGQESASWNAFVDILWQENVSVLVEVITVFLRVLNLVWEVWHFLLFQR